MNSLANDADTSDPLRASRLRRLIKRGESYVGAGQREAAIASFEGALLLDPNNVPCLLQLADLHLKAARHVHARTFVLRAIAVGEVASPAIALQLVKLLGLLGESGMMREVAKQFPPQVWDSPQSLAEMSQQLSFVGANDLALEFSQAGLARDASHPPSLFMRATTAVFYGDMSAAAAHLERCLARVPNDPGSHWLMSRLRLPGAEARIKRIEQLLQTRISLDDESWLCYALHNELHDIKEYERAWVALERGCRAKRSLLRYQPADSTDLFTALLDWKVAEVNECDGYVDSELRPVFIVGMHRSGTTLTERIVSGHSLVAAGGETYDITAALRRASGHHCRGELDKRILDARAGYDYNRIGQEYIQSMRWRASGKPIVTDKLPSNFLNIGFIARALPEARIINLCRDPLDVGLSNLRTLFSNSCPYSYDMLDFADYYRQYQLLMKHWHTILPGRILDVDYEQLVNSPEATAASIAKFCGLEFEPDMIRIEDRSDAVATASSVMMRDGIRRDRGNLWRVYERQMQPLIEALSRQG